MVFFSSTIEQYIAMAAPAEQPRTNQFTIKQNGRQISCHELGGGRKYHAAAAARLGIGDAAPAPCAFFG